MINKSKLFLMLLFLLFILQACTTSSNKEIVNVRVKDIPEQIEIGTFDDAGIKFIIEYSDGEIVEEDVTKAKIPEEYQHYLYEEGNHSFSFLYKGIEVIFNLNMYYVKYHVSFVNAINETVKTEVIKKGETPNFPTNEEMEVEGYRFLDSFDHNGLNINSNIVIKGLYVKTWTVTFYDGFNNIISTQIVDDKENAIEPTNEETKVEGYNFIGWDKSFINVTSDLNIYGIYEKIQTECNHNIIEATCTKSSYCSICKEEFGLPLDHIESEWETVKEATCQETGLKQTKCTMCGEVLSTETIDLIDHNYVNNTCTMCGKTISTKITPYEENGMTYVNIGKYPQTVVDDTELINILNTISTTNSLGYIEYNGNEYKKMVADIYYSDYTYINGNTISEGTTYYFKVEPIKWRVLYQDNNEYTLLCEMLLDNTNYYHTYNENRTINNETIYPNNYKYSNIRAWLNGYDGSTYNVDNYSGIGFYYIAFTEEEKTLIKTTLVDNSVESTGYESNQYACENTSDKVYLLSYKDVTNTLYGFDTTWDTLTSREAIVSDYARAKSCWMNRSSYYGKGDWWLRSPEDNDSGCAGGVGCNGSVNINDVNYSDVAVRPAMKITLNVAEDECTNHIESEWETVKEATCQETGLKQTKCTMCGEVLSTETIDLIDHNYVNNTCTMCGKTISTKITPYEENGMTYVNIGKYPQTVVDDTELINILNTISTTNSLGYIEYNGNEYKKMVADIYYSDYTYINGNTISEGTTYYFKVEPIKWRVLYQDNNEYTLLCEMLLDNTNYYHTYNENRTINNETIYPNNYKYSNIRAWLNGYDGSTYNVDNYSGIGFYYIAFTEEEKTLIKTTLVDNSVESTGYESNQYACENTSDKVYLLSYKDVTNTLYGFDTTWDTLTSRQAIESDYARAKNCYMSTTSYYGKGLWWLRSPSYSNSNYARRVSLDGSVSINYNVYYSTVAVRPAMKIILE